MAWCTLHIIFITQIIKFQLTKVYQTSISTSSSYFWIVLYACVSRAVRGRHRKGHEDRGRSTDVEEWNDRVMPDCRLLFQLDKPDPSHPNSPCSPQFYQSTLHRNHLPWLWSFPTESRGDPATFQVGYVAKMEHPWPFTKREDHREIAKSAAGSLMHNRIRSDYVSFCIYAIEISELSFEHEDDQGARYGSRGTLWCPTRLLKWMSELDWYGWQ